MASPATSQRNDTFWAPVVLELLCQTKNNHLRTQKYSVIGCAKAVPRRVSMQSYGINWFRRFSAATGQETYHRLQRFTFE